MSTPSTFGGPGFRPRTGPHRDDIGEHWTACGVSNDGDPLRAVLLHQPGEELRYVEPPDAWLMLARPKLEIIRRQTDAIAEFFTQRGIAVHRHRPAVAPPPNTLFFRDLFAMTPGGAVLSRMGSQQRAGEERFAAAALASIGVPIIASPLGAGCLEGADALWLDPKTLLVGIGRRTNAAGLATLAAALPGVELHPVVLPAQTQHLLGVLNFLGPGRVAVWSGRTPPALIKLLADRRLNILALPDGPELSIGRAMNWVCLGPNRVLLPSDAPKTTVLLKKNGIEVQTAPISGTVLSRSPVYETCNVETACRGGAAAKA